MNYDTSNIEKILNLSDDSVVVTHVEEVDNQIIVHVQKAESVCFCEKCGCRMESKGPRYRTVNHPILQDGRKLVIKLKTRKWHCIDCGSYCNDTFNFVEKFKQSSNISTLIILDQMKDLNLSAVQIARSVSLSDTQVHETFMRFVDLPRLPLCRVLCIDEVYLKFDKDNLYSVVLMNWETGDIIDILPNRHKDTLIKYFRGISLKERDVVEYLVSDMYETYSSLAGKGSVFRNARSIIDCFHHTQPIITSINAYIFKVRKSYAERDRKRLEEENYRNNQNCKTRKESREVMLLKHYSYFILKNRADISYEPYYRHIKGRGGYMFIPEKIEAEFMALDKNFPVIRELKEMYIRFTHDHMNDPEGAAEELDQLIAFYRNSDLSMFRSFADTLYAHRDGIIASFTFLKAERMNANDEVLHRVSSGPLESFMNVPKDYKRQSNGVRNFEYTRNRILWATRKNPAMRAVPLPREDVHTPGKKRGPYKKNDGKENA